MIDQNTEEFSIGKIVLKTEKIEIENDNEANRELKEEISKDDDYSKIFSYNKEVDGKTNLNNSITKNNNSDLELPKEENDESNYSFYFGGENSSVEDNKKKRKERKKVKQGKKVRKKKATKKHFFQKKARSPRNSNTIKHHHGRRSLASCKLLNRCKDSRPEFEQIIEVDVNDSFEHKGKEMDNEEEVHMDLAQIITREFQGHKTVSDIITNQRSCRRFQDLLDFLEDRLLVEIYYQVSYF